MAEQKSRFREMIETLQIIVQIVAIVLAGSWTYVKFIQTEKPSLKNTDVSRELRPPVMRGEDCLRSFFVTFTNAGKSLLEVERVVTSVWRFPFERDAQRDPEVVLLDLDTVVARRPILTKEFPDPTFKHDRTRSYPFLGTYRHSGSYSHQFEFLFKKEKGVWVFVKTEIFVKGEVSPMVAGAWDLVCGG